MKFNYASKKYNLMVCCRELKAENGGCFYKMNSIQFWQPYTDILVFGNFLKILLIVSPRANVVPIRFALMASITLRALVLKEEQALTVRQVSSHIWFLGATSFWPRTKKVPLWAHYKLAMLWIDQKLQPWLCAHFTINLWYVSFLHQCSFTMFCMVALSHSRGVGGWWW